MFTRTSTAETQVKHKEFKVSYNLSGLLGVEGMVADHIGFYAQGGYFFAPSLENLLGDRHQGGGGVVIAGITGRFRIKRGQ